MPSDQVQREGGRKGRRSAAKDKHPGGFCLLQVSQLPCNWLPQTKGLGFLALTLSSYKINNKNVLFSPMDVQRERVRQETGGQSNSTLKTVFSAAVKRNADQQVSSLNLQQVQREGGGDTLRQSETKHQIEGGKSPNCRN